MGMRLRSSSRGERLPSIIAPPLDTDRLRRPAERSPFSGWALPTTDIRGGLGFAKQPSRLRGRASLVKAAPFAHFRERDTGQII
ncbi:hypothetical protein NDU88_003226 [Pleurodeles waltl]|uniref:Uncharacterized protein n=1 Tax=Pleurodeles waltl TaxID=8319 RepID=A0AAV7TNE0_PLEWA|nr:hypothetical protein NDU88_003226 [Pleurodeles waltl]